jgi:hypothetical protein
MLRLLIVRFCDIVMPKMGRCENTSRALVLQIHSNPTSFAVWRSCISHIKHIIREKLFCSGNFVISVLGPIVQATPRIRRNPQLRFQRHRWPYFQLMDEVRNFSSPDLHEVE